MERKIEKANSTGKGLGKIDNCMKRRAIALHGMKMSSLRISESMSIHAAKKGNAETSELFKTSNWQLVENFINMSEYSVPGFGFEITLAALSVIAPAIGFITGSEFFMKLDLMSAPLAAFMSYSSVSRFAGQIVYFFQNLVREKFTPVSAGYDYLLEKFL